MSQDFKISLNGEIDLKEQEEISKALKKAKIDLEFALGLDEKIPHKSNECGFMVIMGGRDEV